MKRGRPAGGWLGITIPLVLVGALLAQVAATRKDKRADHQTRDSGGDGLRLPFGEPGDKRERSTVEWITLGISAGLILLVAGLIVYSYFSQGVQPVAIEIRPLFEEFRQEEGAYYLPVEVINNGDETAESVRIQLSVPSRGGRETAQLEVQFLAGGATARGVVVFQEDPSQGEVTTDVVSYLEP